MSTDAIKKQNRSAFANFLRAKYDMFTGAARVASYPYYLCVDPCEACQLRCPTCPTGIENESKRARTASPLIYRGERRKMTVELFDSLLDEIGEFLFLVMFYNYGEPLLNRNLPQFIRKAAALDIETQVHTNLSLPMSDELIDELMRSGLNNLIASVDGFSQAAYEIHRVGGDVELVKSNFARLAKARDRLESNTQITYKFLVFGHNEHELDAARRFSDEIGITFDHMDAFVQDPSWLPSHRKGEQPHYSAADMAAIAEQWQAAGRGDYFLEHELGPSWSVLPKDAPSLFPSACGWHYSYSVITSGGPVAPCCAVAKEKDDFGTLAPGTVRFADVWNNDRYAKSRMAFSGQQSDELKDVDTICMRCYFPKLVHHLYSPYDLKVIAQFHRLLGESEPAMARAFELLGSDGLAPDVTDYVAHFEERLMSADGGPDL